MEQHHQAKLEVVYWQDVRDEISKILPRLVEIIDKINPGKEYPLFKAHYPFGKNIVDKGKLQLPTERGAVEPIDSPHVSSFVKDHLKRRDLPVGLMLKNSSEIYYQMPDRIISRFLLRPGHYFGLWGNLNEKKSCHVKWIWSLSSGARSLYLLPKITDGASHKVLRKKYGIKTHAPKNNIDHWQLFSEIANSPAFETEWESTMLFFSDKWFEKTAQDSQWGELYNYFLKAAWQESSYWRDKGTFEVVWEDFICELMDNNIKPNLYLSCMVKQLILIGIGILPGLAVAGSDNEAGPLKELQKVFVNDYKLREYKPLFMHAHSFSLEDEYPTYYSFQLPNLMETIPVSRNLPSVLSALPEISYLMEKFVKKVTSGCVAENTHVETFCNQVKCDYFHYNEEKWNGIRSTGQLPREDARMQQCFGRENNLRFPDTSHILRGCVRFMKKEQI